MKKTWVLLLGIPAILATTHVRAASMTDDDAVAVARSVIRADRQAVVTKALQLTPAEAEKFWPLYKEYRAEMDKIGDGMVNLIQRYATFYPDVPQQIATSMLKDLARLEDEQAATRAEYLKKVAKVIPASKTLRWAQVENRLDLGLRLELASKIPLVPVEGQINATTTTGSAYSEGVAGGIVVQTHELTATVTAVDKANRRVHLLSPDGFKQTVKVGPEAANFDQIRAGDKLKIVATDELVIKMADPSDTSDSAKVTMVALAPRGAKPGGIVSEATQLPATVVALDPDKRTATLRFQDGTTRTYPVRSDLDLSKYKVGDKMLIRLTESVALAVTKP